MQENNQVFWRKFQNAATSVSITYILGKFPDHYSNLISRYASEKNAEVAGPIKLKDQHCIPVCIKTVFVFNRLLVGIHDKLITTKCTYHDQ